MLKIYFNKPGCRENVSNFTNNPINVLLNAQSQFIK